MTNTCTVLLSLFTCARSRPLVICVAGLGKGLEGKAFDDIINTDELVNEDDLAAALTANTRKMHNSRGSRGSGSGSSGRPRSATPEKQQVSDLLRSDSMSARERNKLKRKYKAQRQDSLKADAKGRVRDTGQSTCGPLQVGSMYVSCIHPQLSAVSAELAGWLSQSRSRCHWIVFMPFACVIACMLHAHA